MDADYLNTPEWRQVSKIHGQLIKAHGELGMRTAADINALKNQAKKDNQGIVGSSRTLITVLMNITDNSTDLRATMTLFTNGLTQ